jgi:tetratricopeptide (TPR) repeat protein
MTKHKKTGKNSQRLSRFDPEARKEVTDSELKILEKDKTADFYFLNGEKHRIKGESKQAISCYRKALHIDPEHEDSLFFMGYCCLRALTEEMDRGSEPDKASKAREAVWAFETLIAIRQEKASICWDDYTVYYYLGTAQFGLGQYEEAIKSFSRAINLNSRDAASHYMLGLTHWRWGRYNEAVTAFKHAVRMKPDFGEAHRGLAHIYRESGRHEEAIAAYKEAIKIKPHEAHLHFYLGLSFTLLGRHEEAIASYKEAVKVKPDLAEAHSNLGVAYYALRRYEEALASYREATKVKPDSVEAHCMLGSACGALGRHEEAIASYKEAIRIRPDFAEVHSNLAHAYHELGRHEEAIAAYKEAIRIRPDFVEAHFDLAVNYYGLAYYKKAVRSANKAVELAARDGKSMVLAAQAAAVRAHAHLLMLMCSQAKSDFHQAICFLRRVDDMERTKELRRQLLGFYYWVSGIESYMKDRIDKAKTDFQDALASFKESDNKLLVKNAELVLNIIETDGELINLANSKDIESLRGAAEEILTRTEALKRASGTIEQILTKIESLKRVRRRIKESPRELWTVILAKHSIMRLLVDVLNGKPLDEDAFVDVTETLERFLDEKWDRRFESISILLRKLAKYKTFEEMKKAEHDILGLASDLSVIDGYITGQALKHTSWPLEVTQLLKQQVEQTQELMSELIGFKRQLIGASKPETKQIKFKTREVTVVAAKGKEKSLSRRELSRLAMYVILKGVKRTEEEKRVHWLWAYIILSKFDVTNPELRFRNYMSTAKGILNDHGIHIDTSTEGADGFCEFLGIDEHVVSNIKDVTEAYELARSEYASNPLQAMKTLSKITEDKDNNWYIFIPAYIQLAKWIREENLKDIKNISNDLIDNCTGFLGWYRGKLDRGLERIDAYIEKIRRGKAPPLSREAEKELERIREEFEDAKSLRAALIKKQGLSEEEQAYEKLREHLRRFQKWYWMIEKQAEEKEVYDRDLMVVEKKAEITEVQKVAKTITGVKNLCERSETVHDIIAKSFDILDQLLDRPRGRRSQYTREDIEDMREGVYWKFGEVVDEIKSFGQFDETTGSKFAALKYHLQKQLRKKLEKGITDIKHRAWRELW